MPPKKKRTKEKAIKPNLGDVDVNFTKPEKVEAVEPVETPTFKSVVELANGRLIGLIAIIKTGESENEALYQKGQIQDSGLIEWSPRVKMPEEVFNKVIDGAKPFKLPKPIGVTDFDDTTGTATVEVVIPDGVTELSNGCLVRIVGRTDGAKIQYQKGWRQDSGLINWTPEASMPTEMFNKFLKNMEVKK